MLKRTSIFLGEEVLERVKRISFARNTSMAEVIRQFVRDGCEQFSQDEKDIIEVLGEVRAEAKRRNIAPEDGMKKALELQHRVRSERKKSRR